MTAEQFKQFMERLDAIERMFPVSPNSVNFSEATPGWGKCFNCGRVWASASPCPCLSASSVGIQNA